MGLSSFAARDLLVQIIGAANAAAAAMEVCFKNVRRGVLGEGFMLPNLIRIRHKTIL
jgi:hypothetical protein